MEQRGRFRSQSFLGRTSGFSLVELLVAITILAILATIAVVNIPNLQKRARDSQRLADLKQLQTILEKEINTTSFYPISTESYELENHPWGSFWQEQNYRVPKDPLSSQSYVYVSDGKSYQLYAKFEDLKAFPAFACPTPCGPNGNFNAGIVGQSESAEQGLITWSSNGNEGSIASGFPATPEKPYTPLAQGKQSYTVEGSGSPQLVTLEIDPFDPIVGAKQTVSALMRDGSSVTSVSLIVKTDNGIRTFPLTLISGTDKDGSWGDNWVVVDTHEKNYVMTVRATSSAGSSDQYVIAIR